MKLLTLNTHSLQEEHYEKKFRFFLEEIIREKPDLIALQEVNQSIYAEPVDPDPRMVPVPGVDIPLRSDNHALRVVCALDAAGISCSWAWLPMKLGYGKYDEGMAILSLSSPITAVDAHTISQVCDYGNWRTRMVLGVQTAQRPDWYYTVHMGWWQDEQEPFLRQWQTLDAHLAVKKAAGPVWLLGDFNSPAEVRRQGYDCIADSGWEDSYLMAEHRDEGQTVHGVIDGWREYLSNPDETEGMRIDHIWCSRKAPVERSQVVFNGIHWPVVSDHFGIIITLKGDPTNG